MTSTIAAARSALSRIISGDPKIARAVLRASAKGAVLAVLALLIATYAVTVSQSAPPPPEPLPPFIYS